MFPFGAKPVVCVQSVSAKEQDSRTLSLIMVSSPKQELTSIGLNAFSLESSDGASGFTAVKQFDRHRVGVNVGQNRSENVVAVSVDAQHRFSLVVSLGQGLGEGQRGN